MNGVAFVDDAAVEATSGRMLVTFTSGGDAFRFHLSPNVALTFRQLIIRDSWQVLCGPDAPVVKLEKHRKKGGKANG